MSSGGRWSAGMSCSHLMPGLCTPKLYLPKTYKKGVKTSRLLSDFAPITLVQKHKTLKPKKQNPHGCYEFRVWLSETTSIRLEVGANGVIKKKERRKKTRDFFFKQSQATRFVFLHARVFNVDGTVLVEADFDVVGSVGEDVCLVLRAAVDHVAVVVHDGVHVPRARVPVVGVLGNRKHRVLVDATEKVKY